MEIIDRKTIIKFKQNKNKQFKGKKVREREKKFILTELPRKKNRLNKT